MEIAPILNLLKDLDERRMVLVDYLDYPTKKTDSRKCRELEDPVFGTIRITRRIGRERASLSRW